MSVLPFMPASLKWHPLLVSVLPFTHASTLHDFKYPLLYLIVLNVLLISTLVFTLKNVRETLSTAERFSANLTECFHDFPQL